MDDFDFFDHLIRLRPGVDAEEEDVPIDQTIHACYQCKTMFVEEDLTSRKKYCGDLCAKLAKRKKEKRRRKFRRDNPHHVPRKRRADERPEKDQTSASKDRDLLKISEIATLDDSGGFAGVGISRSLAAYAYQITGQPPGGPNEGSTSGIPLRSPEMDSETMEWLRTNSGWWKTSPAPREPLRAPWFPTVHHKGTVVRDSSVKAFYHQAAIAAEWSMTRTNLCEPVHQFQ